MAASTTFKAPGVPRAALLLTLLWIAVEAGAQTVPAADPSAAALPAPPTGLTVYQAACATCHGDDGKGAARSVVGFDARLPDFTDCAFATAETDVDWRAVVHEGGPIRGLDRHMPAFGDALSPDDIGLAVAHLRTFCHEPAWPRGDLNFPRALFTEKAFPENEYVFSADVSLSGVKGSPGERSIGTHLTYERRIGAHGQIELVVPVEFDRGDGGAWRRGLGDIAAAFKRTLVSSLPRGSIGSAGVEISLPSGKELLGLGRGHAVVEPFVAWGQRLPRMMFLQLHGGAELPADAGLGSRQVFLRTAIGTSLIQEGGFGRRWSPQVEVLWALPERRTAEWDLVPQMHVTLSKIQHVAVSGGVRVPVNLRYREGRRVQAVVSLVWDWFDGGLFEFWR